MMFNHSIGASGKEGADRKGPQGITGILAGVPKFLVNSGGFIFSLALGILLGWFGYLFRQDMNKPVEPAHIVISGRIETVEVPIAAAVSTRVRSVAVKEGSSVYKGQRILCLDSQALIPKMAQTDSAMQAALSAQKEADRQVANIQTEIDIASAKSDKMLVRMFSTKQGRKKKENELRQRMMEAKMMQFQAKELAAKAKATKAEISSKLSYFNIVSPINGICSMKNVEPGEIVQAGRVLLVISDPKSVYMKGYIPEGNLSQIKIGQKAEIYLDSAEQKPLSARISAIDSKPSFTPENIYFKQDRVRQVFGLRLTIDNPDGRAKAGMPAEARILIAGTLNKASSKEAGLQMYSRADAFTESVVRDTGSTL